MPVCLSKPQFIESLREALLNLYNPYELKRSVLQPLLVEQRPDSGMELKQALINTVNELMPDTHTPYDTKAWKYYELLNYCFIDQLEQKEAAKIMLISLRTLQRLLPKAIEILAEKLAADYHLTFAGEAASAHPVDEAPQGLPSASDTWDKETSLLKVPSSAAFIDIRKMLREIAQIFQPISGAEESKVTIEYPDDPWLVMGQVTILRQAVLTAISYFNQQEPDLKITISTEQKRDQGLLCIRGHSPGMVLSERELASKTDVSAALTNLMELLKGSAEIRRASPAEISIRLVFPAQRQSKIMVVDDNADAIRLVEKYLAAGLYTVVGVQNPEQVIARLEKEQPALVLMDVMLPEIDGWMLLSQIRRNQRISKIPVIISTVLPQEELAFTLGADGFLKKPYTRQELLHSLDLHLLNSPA
jgi:CheY-like chemotaxis protein